MGVERGDRDLLSNTEGTLFEAVDDGNAENGDGSGLSEEMGGIHLLNICTSLWGLLLGMRVYLQVISTRINTQIYDLI